MLYRLYVGASDGTVLTEQSEDLEKLEKLFEEFSSAHELVTFTMRDETGACLNETLAKFNRSKRQYSD